MSAALSDVYAIDFGRRTEDGPMWIDLLGAEAQRREHPLSVVEIGVGDGRVPSLVCGRVPLRRWVGIDPSPAMLGGFERRPFTREIETLAVLGDASDSETWATVTRRPSPAIDVVLCAYSTIFLLDPDRQRRVLRHMAYAVRSGGLLAVECFLPTWTTSGRHVSFGACGNPDGDDALWGRVTTYTVNAIARMTQARRAYGPIVDVRTKPANEHGIDERIVIDETIHWVDPSSLLRAAVDAGWLDARVRQGNPVAPGHYLLVGRT